jgi:hypothetical protein
MQNYSLGETDIDGWIITWKGKDFKRNHINIKLRPGFNGGLFYHDDKSSIASLNISLV